jgi:site-specific DNA-methyltransferase (adenine-specific)
VHKIPRNRILVETRQRSGDFKSIRSKDLRDSIEANGLLHPIILVEAPGEQYILVGGGRRLAAIDWLAEDGIIFQCDKEDILPGEIPATFFFSPDEIKRAEAEFEENERRSNLEWQDRNIALAKIHELKQRLNPSQSTGQTARELAPKLNVTVKTLQTATLKALKVIQYMADPAIKHARNENEAYGLAIRKEEAQIRALIVKQSASLPTNIKVIEGDLYEQLPRMESGLIDLIIADPPYGISAGDAGFKNRTIHHHNYEDDPESARSLVRVILTEGFRLTKPRSNLFIFCDIDLFSWLGEAAEQAGWTRFRTPIIWAKSDSEGLAPWGSQGFRRTYELIFFATKGQRGLIKSPVDILRHSRVGRAERDYAAAKPPALLAELIDCATLPGELVLDPCCGSGGTLLAARNLKRAAIGIEKDNNAFNLTMAKLAEGMETPYANPAPAASDL